MRVITFGEVMGRLTPPGVLRLRQALPGSLNVTFAGAEANVAASLAMFGADVEFVTALPKNPLADACVGALRSLGIGTEHLVRSDHGRLGLYFLETGANQRPSQVIYDRDGSSISLTPPEEYNWPSIVEGAGWLHVTGITPAISKQAAESTRQAVETAKQHGLQVSCDLNFRKKLWRWEGATPPPELAERTMRDVLPFVDLVVANEEDCGDVLGIRAAGTDVAAGKLSIERYPDVARQVANQFPNVSLVGITLRESISASHNNWGGMLYAAKDDKAFFAPLSGEEYRPYEIRNIVDRVGAGDSFAAGLIYSLTAMGLSKPQDSIRFAVAASCLAHSIVGDCNYSSRAEVEALMGGAASGRVER